MSLAATPLRGTPTTTRLQPPLPPPLTSATFLSPGSVKSEDGTTGTVAGWPSRYRVGRVEPLPSAWEARRRGDVRRAREAVSQSLCKAAKPRTCSNSAALFIPARSFVAQAPACVTMIANTLEERRCGMQRATERHGGRVTRQSCHNQSCRMTATGRHAWDSSCCAVIHPHPQAAFQFLKKLLNSHGKAALP